MPMRKSTIHACAFGVTLTSSLLATANAAQWNGSYVAEGECFCSGTQGREIDSSIVPTPVGGQSVSQICDRIGQGPALQKINGKFNFPVYQDAQCGHGPFSSASANTDKACAGHRGVAGEDCEAIGPTWDLKSAYAKAAEPALGISDAPAVTGGSRYIKPPVATVQSASPEKVAEPALKAAETTVADIAKARSKSKPIVKAAPLSAEEIRARQLVQMEAARERARARAGQSSDIASAATSPVQDTNTSNSASDELEIILTEEQKALQDIPVAKIKPEAKTESVAKTEPDDAAKKAVETVAESVEKSPVGKDANIPTTVSALKLPSNTRNSAREFDYVEGLPISYDFGGAGMGVAASISSSSRMQYLVRAAVAETYREAFVGIGVFMSPPTASRLTFLLNTGIEYGKFEFQGANVGANLSETGAYIGLSSRFVVNNRFELQAGVGYSSFFEGDATAFGAAFYHLTPNLDLTSKAEAGDNDSFGIGVRYYY